MSIDDLEQQLRSSLSRQADAQHGHGHGADMADVFGRARRIRRRRTALVASAAALAVVAVAVPAGVLVASRDTSAPPPPVSTVSSTPTPTPTPTPPSSPSSPSSVATASGSGLGGIAMGAPTTLTYLDPAGKMHNGRPLPDPARGGDLAHSPVSAFTAYHGGWLVIYDGLALRQYDASGTVVDQAAKNTALVTSDDQMQVAWQAGRTVHAGGASGMGNGQLDATVSADEGLIGILPDGPLVADTSTPHARLRVLTGPASSRTVSADLFPMVASSTANLIGGDIGTPAKGDQEGAMADGSTGAILWHGSWRPVAFNDDGTYVAAVPAADNGDASAVAILDARTGRVVTQTPKLDGKVYLGLDVAWDGDKVLIAATDAHNAYRQALLALNTNGQVVQVSPTVTQRGGNPYGFVLMSH